MRIEYTQSSLQIRPSITGLQSDINRTQQFQSSRSLNTRLPKHFLLQLYNLQQLIHRLFESIIF